jgi:hypothetical protein
LTVIHEPQIHLPNPSYLHDDVEHEDVEDPSQGFVDWDFPPTYDININNKDLMGGSSS